MSNENERAEFEKWAAAREYDLSIEPAYELAKDWSARYFSRETRNLARGWKARSRSGAVPASWRDDVYLAAQMLTWGRDDGGLLPSQECEIDAHQAKLFAMLAAAPEPRQAADELHPRTRDLLDRFSAAMADKLLAAQRKYGYSDGWANPGWMDECRAQLLKHVAKGDPRDVANYCAFLWHHGESTAVPVSPHHGDAPVADTGGRYFSFGDEYGFDTHTTAEQARKSAEDSLQGFRDAAHGDGWDEGVHNICWGVMLGGAEVINRTPIPEFDLARFDAAPGAEYLDYGIVDYAAPVSAPADARESDALDARRYRLLRRGQRWSVIDGIGNTLRAEDLDSAIDSAMGATGGVS